MIHTVNSFSVVSEAEVGFFLDFSCFFYDPTDVGSLILGKRKQPGLSPGLHNRLRLGESASGPGLHLLPCHLK